MRKPRKRRAKITTTSTGFGDRLHGLREELRLTQEALAQRVADETGDPTGHTNSWVSKLEGGKSEPTLFDLAALARALGTTVGWLVTGAESGDSEWLGRLRSLEPQLDRRGLRAVITVALQQIEDTD